MHFIWILIQLCSLFALYFTKVWAQDNFVVQKNKNKSQMFFYQSYFQKHHSMQCVRISFLEVEKQLSASTLSISSSFSCSQLVFWSQPNLTKICAFALASIRLSTSHPYGKQPAKIQLPPPPRNVPFQMPHCSCFSWSLHFKSQHQN